MSSGPHGPIFKFHVYLLNRILYLLNSLNKTLENEKKMLEKLEKFVSPKMWESWVHSDQGITSSIYLSYLYSTGRQYHCNEYYFPCKKEKVTSVLRLVLLSVNAPLLHHVCMIL